MGARCKPIGVPGGAHACMRRALSIEAAASRSRHFPWTAFAPPSGMETGRHALQCVALPRPATAFFAETTCL